MRGLFGSGPNHVQLGYDFSSLEGRIQGHFCFPYTGGEQLSQDLIAEKPNDIHCFDSKTEILTEDGWKTFGNLTFEDKVAQYDTDSDQTSFVTPIDIVWQSYSGNMIEFKNLSTDMVVTPNHRVLYKEHPEDEFFITDTAQEIYQKKIKSYYKCTSIVTTGSDDYPKEFYELVLAVQADGHLSKDCNAIVFTFVKERKIERLKSLLDTLDVQYTEKSLHRKGRYEVTIRLKSKDKYTLILRSWFDTDKKLVKNFNKLSLDTRKYLIESIQYWDGTVNKYSAIVLDSTDYDFIDSLQGLCCISGYVANCREYNKKTPYGECKIKRLYISPENNSTYKVFNTHSKYRGVVDYHDHIGCVSVPTGYVVVRRNGKVFISGNTLTGKRLGISRQDAKSINYACVPKGTLICTSYHGLVPIEKIKPDTHTCHSFDPNTFKNKFYTKIEKLLKFEDKELFEVTTDQGFTVQCTMDHRWYVYDNDTNRYLFVTLEDYFEGDYDVIRQIKGINQDIYKYKFLDVKSLGIQDTYCLVTETSSFYYRQDDLTILTGNCLYGAQPAKLGKMLLLSPDEAVDMYNNYWDSLPALKELKEKVEMFWESTNKSYILAIDKRKLMARSKHSLLNLLFQGSGSLSVKYTVVLTAQKLEELGLLGNVLEDNLEESLNKIYSMIIYHKLMYAR